jgi:propionyl-CoA carboxylase beta chain
LSTADKLAGLRRLREEALLGGGEQRVAQQHERGKLTARERVELLLDDDSFTELDAFVTHRASDFGMEDERYLGDGVITGHGRIDGRPVFVYSQDFTIFGGSLSEAHAEKICKVMDLAVENGAPIIGLSDSGGARIQEGVVSLGGYADIFLRNTLASGVVPQLSLVMGPCAGGAVYSPAITDFTIMVDGTSYMFVTGPTVVKTVTHEEIDLEGLGGARVHNQTSGVAHFLAAGEPQAIELARRLIDYWPQNNLDPPPRAADWAEPAVGGDELDALVPDSPQRSYDMHRAIGGIVDGESFTEVHAEFARNVICGFARVEGRSLGIAARGSCRRPGHRLVGQGGSLRPLLRLLQHSTGDAGRRAGLSSRGRPGASRHHSTWRQAAVRLQRGDGAEGDHHHPQGVRRRLRRDEQQAHPRRPELCLANRRDRGDGR